jgi:hypothetical protein
MRDREELRADDDPDSLTLALLTAALSGGMLLAKTACDPAPLKAALSSALEHVPARQLEPVPIPREIGHT